MLETTQKLIEHENKELEDRKKLLIDISSKIRKLLVDNNIILDEWRFIVNTFNVLHNSFISNLKISDIKENKN